MVWLIGAHRGEDAVPFLQAKNKIYCLEANPLMCEQLFALEGPVFIKNSALVKPTFSDSEVTFYISNDKSEWGTLENSRVSSGSKFTDFISIKTPVIRLSELVENWDCPDIIICDIEGSETEAFVIPLTNNHIEFFNDTLICCEVSKDNWREILRLFAQTRRLFSIVVNGEIFSNDNSAMGERGGVGPMLRSKFTSSIGSFLSGLEQSENSKRWYSKLEIEQNLEMWFRTKNKAWTFNYDTWVDLIIWPNSQGNLGRI